MSENNSYLTAAPTVLYYFVINYIVLHIRNHFASCVSVRNNNFIAFILLLALALGQYSFAHHNAVHFDHGSEEIHIIGDQDQNDHSSSRHECPECLASKLFQSAFYNSVSSALQNPVFVTNEYGFQIGFYRSAKTVTYNPRAPPFFLIS